MADIDLNITPLFTVANQVLVKFFKMENARNHYSHLIQDTDTGEEYIITMQRVAGETPLHQLAAATERIAQLEHALSQALGLAGRESEDFGAARADVVGRLEEALAPTNTPHDDSAL